jgi:hypothetical protein
MISPITTRTGSPVALPSSLPFFTDLHHKACSLTQPAARRVIDTTRDWLQDSLSPEQMR